MKYMVISDIHGNINNLNKVLDIYHKEECSKLLILGDLFNYGIDLNKKNVINILNNIKDDIICVRGNCDFNISNIEFNMPYIQSLNLNNKNIIITHGHIYKLNQLLNKDFDICYVGHTHIASIDTFDNKIIANPGSISKSRSGENSFIITDNNSISIRNLDNKILCDIKIVK